MKLRDTLINIILILVSACLLMTLVCLVSFNDKQIKEQQILANKVKGSEYLMLADKEKLAAAEIHKKMEEYRLQLFKEHYSKGEY